MVNQKLNIGLIAVTLSSILIFAVALPAANALTPRDFQYFNDNHKTDRFFGPPYVCGDHICTPDEWSAMKQDLRKAQRDPSSCSQLRDWKICGAPVSSKSG